MPGDHVPGYYGVAMQLNNLLLYVICYPGVENEETKSKDSVNNYIFGNLLSEDNGHNDVVRSLPHDIVPLSDIKHTYSLKCIFHSQSCIPTPETAYTTVQQLIRYLHSIVFYL